MSTIQAPLDLDVFARINGTADVLRALGDAIGGSLSSTGGTGTLDELVYVDYFARLVRERWGEDYEEVAEFHEAEARSAEQSAALLRFLARSLDSSAASLETIATTESERAQGCQR
jgi:hypothetical protein